MRKLLLLLAFLSFLTQIHSQTIPETKVDSMLVSIDKTSFTSGILYDRTVPWAHLNAFNENSNISNLPHFEQALVDLYRASNEQKFIPLNTLRASYTDKNIQNVVDIGIINATFHQINYIETDENEGGLRKSNESFEKINNNKDAFIKNHAFVVSPLKEYLRGLDITYKFNSSFLMEDTENMNLVSLTANFDTVTDYNVFENGNFNQNSITVQYQEEGYKLLTFTAIFNDGTSKTTNATIHTKLAAPPPTGSVDDFVDFESEYQWNGIYGKLDYRIFYYNNNKILYKPIIIIDGFDPGDKRKIQDSDSDLPPDKHDSIEEFMEYDSDGNRIKILDTLKNLGYDVVIINQPTYTASNGQQIDGGADYIERNALTHVSLYKHLNARLATVNSPHQLVIIGPSMGGQISRYALAYMEKESILHNTRLWVSVDSPHLGANISLGLQSLVNQAADSGRQDAQDFVDNQLGSVAAKQQLIEQYNGSSGNNLNIDYMNGRTYTQGFSERRGHPFFKEYYDNLFNNGLTGSNGYPQNLRKIAIANGSLKGNDIFNVNAQLQDDYIDDSEIGINIRGFLAICSPWPFCWDAHVASLEAFALPSFNSYNKVSRFKSPLNGDHSKYVSNYNSRGNMDNVPGGWFPGFDTFVGSIDTDPFLSSATYWFMGEWLTLLSIINEDIDFDVHTNKYVHSFIPTISSLGFKNPDFNWTQNLNRDLVCTSEIPFDTYFGPQNNEQHTSFTEASVNWLLQELAGNPQPPTVYSESSDLIGPDAVCQSQPVTYYFDNCKSPGVTSWSVTGDLAILYSDSNSVTVEVTASTRAPASINYSTPYQYVEKQVWVGEPQMPSGSLGGPEIVNTGTSVTYTGSAAAGATSYAWTLPGPFQIQSPYDYFSPNWQITPVYYTSTNAIVFTGNGEHNGRVEFMGTNNCGQGAPIYLDVVHGQGGPGGGQNQSPVPVPNSADDNFSLDFTEYPEGTFYIFIYDENAVLQYEGQSTNIDKVISTSELPQGHYFLHIHDINGLTIKHLFVEH